MKHNDIIKNIVSVLDEKKAQDIKVIEISELTIVADCFIIASGTSNTHIKSLSGDIEDKLSKMDVEPDHVEGRATGWILLDYGTVVVHIFQKESREFYNLERLWHDAKIMDVNDILN